ncbi:MAG: T9SS type A sorting domain-containing protein [Candidatus Fermentibacter sp.]|nr:T9SS type A sorting domain-containing protein [Candidatus Fermentibacter sp.]
MVHYGSATDPFYASSPADNQARLSYYGISAFPTVMMDGLYDCWPLSTMDGYFDTRMAVPCYLSIDVSADSGSTSESGTLTIGLATDIGLDTDAVLNAMLTESGVPGTGTYASQGIDYNFGLRANLCSTTGMPVSFGTAPESQDIQIIYEIPPEWDWDQLYLTTFVQSPVDDEVLNSHMVKMSDLFGTGIGGGGTGMPVALVAGPNPSTGTVEYRVEGLQAPATVSIFSIDGRLVGESTLSEGVFVIGTPGVYILRMETGTGETASAQVVVIR